MSLHVERTGSGAPLLLIHGWGMHGGIWSDMVPQLAPYFQAYCVDLPGHGASAAMGVFTLDGVVDRLAAQFDQPVTVCGWSLGGQIALHWAAREPEIVKRLVLVTSTPCFAERKDWPFGMPQDTLRQFAAELEMDHAATLREILFSRGEPDPDSLRGGLAILREADLRDALPGIMQPALVIAGERDRITPPEASQYLAERLPNARLALIRGAAHAPFLSHAPEFVEYVIRFLDE